jgi:competence protein ComEC
MLRRYIPDTAAIGLAEALLLGYRSDMDRDLLQAYSHTGVVHVIAVSGMHLGLLYYLLNGLLSLCLRGRKNRLPANLLVLILLWLFSLLTGGQASVIRSALMFTLLEIGKFFSRTNSPLNTLAGSAFLLLAFRPSWLSDTGFQLSYAAVAGIMMYQRAFQAIFKIYNPAAGWLWEMTSITLSAQVFTTPCCLYDFRQFPVLFLFSNLVAVPLSGLILVSEIILCCLSPFPFLASLAGEMIGKLIVVMNAYILQVDRVPFALIENIQINGFQAVLLMFVLALPLEICLKPRKSLCLAWLTLVGFISVVSAVESYRYKRQKEMAILQVPGKTALVLVKGTNITLYSDSEPGDIQAGFRQTIQALHRYYRCRSPVKYVYTGNTSYILHWENHQIAVAGRDRRLHTYPIPEGTDILVCSYQSDFRAESLTNRPTCTIWICAAGNAMWKIQQWKKQAERLHLRFHSVPEEGTFILQEKS